MKYDVIGIGNPLMDMLIQVDHGLLMELNLEKGAMHLVEHEQLLKIQERIKKEKVTLAPGGSVANTISGIAALGGSVVLCGRVGDEEHGAIYEQKVIEKGITSKLKKTKGLTGRAITFITPDSERTFATHLGVALTLAKEDLLDEDITSSKYLHLTAYELEDKNLRDTMLYAMDIAKKAGVKISIDIADPNLIRRNHADLLDIVKTYADVVFANEEEAKAFTQKEAEAAASELAKLAEIAVVKLGAEGSLVQKGEHLIKIDPVKTKVVDTTGAGDMFAAGFLHALSHGQSLHTAGDLGSFMAARVISQIGARLDESKLKKQAADFIKKKK